MDFQVSKYAYLFESSKGKKLLYCTKGNSILECPDDVYEILCQAKGGDSRQLNLINEEIQTQLKEHGIICTLQDDIEFLERLKFISQASQHNTKRLGIIIVPTLDCNFACPYCFEKHKRTSTMSLEVEDKLIEFILDNAHKDPINLYWYGGEALLGVNKIKSILSKLSSSVEIDEHVLITNGYLLTPEIYSVFNDTFPLNEIQITLDGKRERHDNLRSLVEDSTISTYDIIFRNITSFAKHHPSCRVNVRVNVDKTNYEDFIYIQEQLQEYNIHSNINVYAGMIRLENEAQTHSIEPAFSRQERMKIAYMSAKQNRRSHTLLPDKIYAKGCMANRVNSFIIGPEGELYKCWNDVSDPQKVIGSIFSDKITNPQLYYRYHSSCAWHNDQQCLDCLYIPVCNGKCAWYQERNKFHHGKFFLCQCILKNSSLRNKILEDYYEYVSQNID